MGEKALEGKVIGSQYYKGKNKRCVQAGGGELDFLIGFIITKLELFNKEMISSRQ